MCVCVCSLADIAKRGVLSLVGEIPRYKKEHYDNEAEEEEEEAEEEEEEDVTSLSVNMVLNVHRNRKAY